MLDVQQQDLKRKIRANYAATLHALVATRGVLLQAVPMPSIYASTMSSTPIMVHSKHLRANVPELFISSPLAEARALEQEAIDEQEWIRRANLTDPRHILFKSKMVKVPMDVIKRIDVGNTYNRDRMRKIMAQPPATGSGSDNNVESSNARVFASLREQIRELALCIAQRRSFGGSPSTARDKQCSRSAARPPSASTAGRGPFARGAAGPPSARTAGRGISARGAVGHPVWQE